jgi:hypothetical protein
MHHDEGRKTDYLSLKPLSSSSIILLNSGFKYEPSQRIKTLSFLTPLQYFRHPRSYILPPSSSHNLKSMMEGINKDNISLKPLRQFSS